MSDKLAKILCGIKCQPEEDLSEHIWQTVMKRERRIAKIELYLFSLVGLISLASLVPAFKMLTSDVTQSGFYQYTSLLFSDGGSVLSHWRVYTLSLAESLPSLSIALSLSLIFIFFLSIKNAVRHINKGQSSLTLSV